MMSDPLFLIVSIVAILIGGVVKGFSGYGLPMVAMPLMANFVPAPLALALLSTSVVVTNIAQAANPALLVAMVRRFWLLYISLAIGIAAGASILVALSARTLDIVVGTSMVTAAMARGSRPSLRLPEALAFWLQPAVGFFGGLIGGLSAMFGPPLIIFMNLLGLSQNEFVVALSVAYVIGLIPMVATLVAHGWLGGTELIFSLLAVFPVLAAMAVGRRYRGTLNRRTLEILLVALLFLSGLRILTRGLLA